MRRWISALIFLLYCSSASPLGLSLAAPEVRLLGIGVNAPFGFSADGATWNFHYASWAAAMPTALKNAIIKAGFNTVRLHVDPLPLFLAADDATINSLLTQPLVAVTDLTNSGLRVVFNFGIQASPSSVAGWGASDVIDNVANGTAHYNRMVHCAVLTAQALLPYGDKVLFELFNEPPPVSAFTGTTWATQQNAEYDAIRAVAPSLKLVVSPMNQGDIGTLITTPYDPSHFDINTFISIHDYTPPPFTSQDIPSFGGAGQYINRLEWPPGTNGQTRLGTEAAAAALVDADTSTTSGQKTTFKNTINSLIDTYFNTPYDVAWLQNRFGLVATWADSYSVQHYRVFLGEFGCVGDPSADNPRSGYVSPANGGLGASASSRVTYYSTVSLSMRSNGFSRSTHSLEIDPYEITDGTQVLVPSITSAIVQRQHL